MRTTIPLDSDKYKIVRMQHNQETGPPVFSISENAPLFGPEEVAEGEDEG